MYIFVGMLSLNRKDKEYFVTYLLFIETRCKVGKGIGLTWRSLYQTFAHEEYSQFPFQEGKEDKAMEIYFRVSQSYLHREVA